jgi:hypothetical protein
MNSTIFLAQLKLAFAGALLVLGLGWFLAGSKASLLLLLG